VRCALLWPGPAQRQRLLEIRDNLVARISKARREAWLGEVEGLEVSLAGANDKLAQLERLSAQPIEESVAANR
jgi:hypothetical protein